MHCQPYPDIAELPVSHAPFSKEKEKNFHKKMTEFRLDTQAINHQRDGDGPSPSDGQGDGPPCFVMLWERQANSM